jgi:hypothetical protein
MTWLDTLRSLLWSLYGDVPADFDEAAAEAMRQVKPEENGNEVLRWLLRLLAAALVLVIIVLVAGKGS